MVQCLGRDTRFQVLPYHSGPDTGRSRTLLHLLLGEDLTLSRPSAEQPKQAASSRRLLTHLRRYSCNQCARRALPSQPALLICKYAGGRFCYQPHRVREASPYPVSGPRAAPLQPWLYLQPPPQPSPRASSPNTSDCQMSLSVASFYATF